MEKSMCPLWATVHTSCFFYTQLIDFCSINKVFVVIITSKNFLLEEKITFDISCITRKKKGFFLFGLNLQTKWNEKWMLSVTLRRLLWGVSESTINISTPFSYKKASRQWAANLQTGEFKYFFQASLSFGECFVLVCFAVSIFLGNCVTRPF